jgi:hypothetical protein
MPQAAAPDEPQPKAANGSADLRRRKRIRTKHMVRMERPSHWERRYVGPSHCLAEEPVHGKQ